MTDFIVALIGLPLCGKSFIIDSLIFKKSLQSKIISTTNFKQIDEYIYDDENNKFKICKFSGLQKFEKKYNNIFNEFPYKNIINSTLIIWVSDITNAFLTKYEIDVYNELKKYVKNVEITTGTLYYIIILLSKCDKNFNNIEINNYESINLNNSFLQVKNKFPDDDIILYNACGRSYYNKKSPLKFKTFIQKIIDLPTEHNIIFDITKYIYNHNIDQDNSYYNKFLQIYDQHLITKNNNIMIYWKNISTRHQLEHLLEVCEITDANNYQKFIYVTQAIVYFNIKAHSYDNIRIFLINHYLINNHLYTLDIIISNCNKLCLECSPIQQSKLLTHFLTEFLILRQQK